MRRFERSPIAQVANRTPRFAQYVEAEMKTLDMTVAQVSHASGLPVDLIRDILSGREPLTGLRAFGLATAFGVSEALLLELDQKTR